MRRWGFSMNWLIGELLNRLKQILKVSSPDRLESERIHV